MLPVSTPPERPVVLTETPKLTGVEPLDGVTLSHELPEVTATFTVVGLEAATGSS
jgi:hypothetical protein